MVICLERGADLHMFQLMPPPLTVSCSCKIQISFTCVVQRAVKRARVCVCVCVCVFILSLCLTKVWLCKFLVVFLYLTGITAHDADWTNLSV